VRCRDPAPSKLRRRHPELEGDHEEGIRLAQPESLEEEEARIALPTRPAPPGAAALSPIPPPEESGDAPPLPGNQDRNPGEQEDGDSRDLAAANQVARTIATAMEAAAPVATQMARSGRRAPPARGPRLSIPQASAVDFAFGVRSNMM
jgi:hypothetical protein